MENLGAAGAGRVPAGPESGSPCFPQPEIRDPGIRIHLGLTPGCRQGPTEKRENAARIWERFGFFPFFCLYFSFPFSRCPGNGTFLGLFPLRLMNFNPNSRFLGKKRSLKIELCCFPLKILLNVGKIHQIFWKEFARPIPQKRSGGILIRAVKNSIHLEFRRNSCCSRGVNKVTAKQTGNLGKAGEAEPLDKRWGLEYFL